MEIHGHCDSGFERVKDAFSENFRQRAEAGASVAVSIDEKMVVDLWAGVASQATQARGAAIRSSMSIQQARASRLSARIGSSIKESWILMRR